MLDLRKKELQQLVRANDAAEKKVDVQVKEKEIKKIELLMKIHANDPVKMAELSERLEAL